MYNPVKIVVLVFLVFKFLVQKAPDAQDINELSLSAKRESVEHQDEAFLYTVLSVKWPFLHFKM